MKQIPTGLTLRLEKIFSKEEISTLTKAAEQEGRAVSFRVNALKSNLEKIKIALDEAKIGYSHLNFPKDCFVLDIKHRESEIWKLKIYKKGHIYMQGISSQIPTTYFNAPDTSDVKILDACAAPGGKTSQLSESYPNAQIYALEPNKVRFERMQHNLSKLGCENVTSIHDETRNISQHVSEENYFDMVLIDAPCSSEGSLSIHNEKFLDAWDISHINKNYRRQKYIIDDILPYLKTGGELIYSTCTLAPEENEALTHYILCNYPEMQLEQVSLEDTKYVKNTTALKSFGKQIYKTEISEKCIRVLPSEFSEGFFIAKFNKKAT